MPQVGYFEIGDVSSPLVRAMFDHWRNIRGDRPMPLKADFDPASVPQLLPYLVLEEVHRNPFRIRYRVVGTEQARFIGEDFTGGWLDEMDWEPKIVERLLTQYRMVIERRAPLFGASLFFWIDGYEKAFEWGIFPFTQGDEEISHFLSIEDFYNIDRNHVLRLLEEQNSGRRRP